MFGRKGECAHEFGKADTPHGLKRRICVRCDHVSIEAVDTGVTKAAVPSLHDEVDASRSAG